MTISKNLFLSILSMDVYNRGNSEAGIWDQRIDDPDGLGFDAIDGFVNIKPFSSINVSVEDLDSWKNSGFFALAYEVTGAVDGIEPGTTVIVYRGTNDAPDYTRGWTVGSGAVFDWTQAPDALSFYQKVTGKHYSEGPADGTIVTGHSLGSGLIASR
ncbi:MAG: hypothetical protein AAFU41_07575 [Pseudomonadota bacterium]